MSIKQRKEREKEEMRELILNAAGEIIAQEGIDSLSLRKIASKIEYSPAIIYHYFKDKEDIINQQMRRGYQKIVGALQAVQIKELTPTERLRALTRSYIQAALQMPDEFMKVQLNSSPAILEHTASLFPGAAEKKPALRILYQSIKEAISDKTATDEQIELTAQVIACTTLGLIIKLIVEKEIGEEQKERLIEHYIKCMVNGMILGKSIYE